MPKLNPFAMTRPHERVESRAFTDPAQGGVELILTLDFTRNAIADVQIAARVNAHALEYLTPPTGEPLRPFLPVGGRMTPTQDLGLTMQAVQQLSLIECLQSGEDRYGFEELLALCLVMPDAMREAMAWAANTYYEGMEPTENPS